MGRQDFLEELTPNFPPKAIYSYDENYQYNADRQMLMDEVLVGTFNSFVRELKELAFSYRITADEKFFLDVSADGQRWTKTFDYVTDAFDIAEAAYRFFVVMPRVLSESDMFSSDERALTVDQKSFEMHDHCQDFGEPKVELIYPPCFSFNGHYLQASIYLCTNDSYTLAIHHVIKEKKRPILNMFFWDIDFAKLLALGYLEIFDQASYPLNLGEAYARVHRRTTH
jgi:hypothetical protein